MRGWLVYVVVGLALSIDASAFGAWFTASRAYVRDVYGVEAYTFVALLAGVEGFTFILSPLAGLLGDVYGRTRVAFLGVLRAPLTPLIAFVDPTLIPVIVFFISTLSTLFYTNALGLLLGLIRGSGRLYGLATLATPLAYGFGSVIPGLLEPVGGYKLVFLSIGLLDGLSPLMLLLAPGNPRSSSFNIEVAWGVLRAIPLRLIVAILLGNIALTLYWNVMSIKLYEITGSLLAFGFIGGLLTTIMSTIARPLAGALVDRFKADIVLALTYIAYIAYNTLLYHTGGLIFILLWLIPIYPFRDVAQTMALSRRVDQNLQATLAGVINTLWGLTSITYMAAYILGVGLLEAFYIQALTLGLGLVLVAWLLKEKQSL